MWVEGTANETYIRRSLQTASWERAQGLALEIEQIALPREDFDQRFECGYRFLCILDGRGNILFPYSIQERARIRHSLGYGQ